MNETCRCQFCGNNYIAVRDDEPREACLGCRPKYHEGGTGCGQWAMRMIPILCERIARLEARHDA